MFDVILWQINICYCWQVFGEPFFRNTDDAGPILESKGMGPIFQKKKKRGTKKGKIFENLGKNVQNLKIFWKREDDCVRLLHTIKLLE